MIKKILPLAFLLFYYCYNNYETSYTDDSSIYSAKCLDLLAERNTKTTIVEKQIKVRLTVYWARGGGTDMDSAKRRSSSGSKLKEGVSVAVDPKLIPFYKRLYIPNLGFRVAHDTGTAVKTKKASNGRLPVIDVFFLNKRDALKFAYDNPKIVTVSVYKY